MNFSSMKYLLKEGVKNVWNNRMMSFASIGVLVSCLLLTGAAVLFSANLSYAMKDIQDENVVTVYLKQEVGELEAVTLGSELKEIPNIKEIVFVSQQEALEQYTEILGPLFEGLEEDNFLPNAYRVTMEDLSLYDETVDDSRPLELFDPDATWKRKTFTDFEAKELLVPIFRNGKLVYQSPTITEMRAYCAAQIDLLWDEVKRFENPHNYYVDLSQKLWDIKQALLKEQGRE